MVVNFTDLVYYVCFAIVRTLKICITEPYYSIWRDIKWYIVMYIDNLNYRFPTRMTYCKFIKHIRIVTC